MNDKKYSDWLVVSDIDGTLNHKLRFTPKINIDAVNDFVNNKNGNFTLASARNVQSLSTHYKKMDNITTPAIVMNGAGIYDFTKEKMIWLNAMPSESAEVIKKTVEKFPHLDVAVFTDDMIYLLNPKIASRFMMALDSLRHKIVKSANDIPKENWAKVIFFTMPHMKKKVRAFVESLDCPGVTYIDTTAASFDMVKDDTNKGTAVMKLSEMLGINKNNIGAIGDYYNDFEMLKTVKHPACCKQAPEDIQNVCEYVACHCNKGAVADFLRYIYKTY